MSSLLESLNIGQVFLLIELPIYIYILYINYDSRILRFNQSHLTRYNYEWIVVGGDLKMFQSSPIPRLLTDVIKISDQRHISVPPFIVCKRILVINIYG